MIQLHRTFVAALVGLTLSSCMIFEHMLDFRPPPAVVMNHDGDRVWRPADAMDINGVWIDSDGTRVRLDLTNGIGKAQVLTEDAKFIWTDGDVLVKAQSAQITRRLNGDKVDSSGGTLRFSGERGSGVLSIDFTKHGTWQREEPFSLPTNWFEGEVPLTLEHTGGDSYRMTNAGGLEWRTASGWIRGSEGEFDLVLSNGASQKVRVSLDVGTPKVNAEHQALLDANNS